MDIDDEDDEEFELDPLDWLLDDERDAEEEELLAQLVQMHPVNGPAAGSSAAVPTLPRRQSHQSGSATGAVATVAGRRTQREAARRATERIAMKQRMLMQQQQQQQHGLRQDGAPALQPLIPAAAAGGGRPGSAREARHSATAAAAASTKLLYELSGHPSDFVSQQQQQPQQQADDWAAMLSVFPGGPPAREGLGQLDGPAAVEHGVHAAQPMLLTLSAKQLQQLHHQITLHTQLLTQLYVITARDASSRSSNTVASAAGQMLVQLQQLHLVASRSFRGMQIAQLLQQAFAIGAADAGAAGAAGAAGLPAYQGREGSATAAAAGRGGPHPVRAPLPAAKRSFQPWRPSITDMK
jgi:hypothetical protein